MQRSTPDAVAWAAVEDATWPAVENVTWPAVDDLGWPAVFVAACAICVVALAPETSPGTAAPAALLLVGSDRSRSDFTTLVGWLVGGSLVGAAGGYVAVTFASVPLSVQGGVGLGLALGGGLGAVSNLLAADDDVDPETDPDSVTVDMDAANSPTPRPADLFDGHPDPVLYVTDEGHGPVVLAANQAFADTFDVPADAVSNTPLGEVLLVNDDGSAVVSAVESGETFDGTFQCQTPAGPDQFRVRTTGSSGEGYVIYTPTDGAA